MTTLSTPTRATLADLARVTDKAELVDGRIVHFMPTGYRPTVVAGRIFRRLADHADATGQGVALGDGVGFTFPELSTGRESFSPDVSYYTGLPPTDPMRFINGVPDLAVEVRSASDYGPAAELEMAIKRAEYFEAGTRVVWDVDPVAQVVRRYRPAQAAPTVFGLGSDADAEPAVPGWRVAVAWVLA
jgi:Uma2 family endonuclease